jgi:hypothetical protein
MLAIMNDARCDDLRRDRMAIAAACYVHPRVDRPGKKDEAAEAAANAGYGTDWGDDLTAPMLSRN